VPRLAIVDAGPLVAFVDRRDRYHVWARDRFRELQAPLLVCEPVLVETLFLLRRFLAAQDAIMAQVQAGRLHIAFSLAENVVAVRHLLTRYADVPMSLGDACIVRMSEVHGDHDVFTLDSDFHVYRKHGRASIPLLMPGS
jgi:predicted nucleic acid-binding protein